MNNLANLANIANFLNWIILDTGVVPPLPPGQYYLVDVDWNFIQDVDSNFIVVLG